MPDEDKPKTAAAAPRTKTVTLKKEHKHRGIIHPPGEQIEVRPDQEERLKRTEKI